MSKPLAYFRRDKYHTVQGCSRILIRHIDNRLVPMPRPYSEERRLTRLLAARSFLQIDESGTGTVLTDLGREALAAALAEMAELLLAARVAETELWRRSPQRGRYSLRLPARSPIPGPQRPEISAENSTPFSQK